MKTIKEFYKDKENNNIIAWSTAYNFWQGKICEESGCDLILCGDSFANVELGYNSTIFVDTNDMLNVVKSVRNGAKNTHIVGDFPFGSYEISDEQAVETAIKFIKAGANSIKLEGGNYKILKRIKAISDVGIPVISHIAVKPQTAQSFNCQGKTIKSFEEIYNDALSTISYGASIVLIEGMAEKSAQQIQKKVKEPVYGIGAGKLDGILSIFHDTIGLFPNFRPYFAKNYLPQVISNFITNYNSETFGGNITQKEYGRKNPDKDGIYNLALYCMKQYVQEVKHKTFPDGLYSFSLKEEELHELRKSKFWKQEYEN